jgi:glycosyltransferase involved in cell wall biosynthesis
MKVLQIISSLHTGGAEKLLVDSISIYKDKGIDMELLLLNGNETPFLQLLKKQNVKIHKLSTGNIKKIYNPLFIFRIIPHLKRYDIIHVHLFPTLYWVALAKIMSFSKIKTVYTEHSTHNKRRNYKFFKPIERIIYKQYSKIICISENARNNLCLWLNEPFENIKFVIINNGICLDKYQSATPIALSELGIPEYAIPVLMTARFNILKDHKTLINAFHLLKDDKLFLIFAGDGHLRNEMENLVKDLQIENRVKFLGIRNDIPNIIKASRICVLPSVWEGFGLVAVEYMAAGKPAIVSNVDGLRDVVENAGLLFEPGNIYDLKEKIELLLNDETKYKEIAYACQQRAKEFSIEKMVDLYIHVYEKIIHKS